MAIKMRVLCYPEKKKALAIANLIKAKYELSVNAVDRIPSAYACDRERIVILMVNLKANLTDEYTRYIRELTKARAANVAIISAGSEEGVAKTKEILAEAGTNVIDKVLNVKMGLFDSKVTAEEEAAILEWVEYVKSPCLQFFPYRQARDSTREDLCRELCRV